jgi:rod shape determining protein RodA
MARRSWRNFDYLLLLGLLLLAVYGLVMIYSATINTLGLDDPLQRQAVFVAAGLAILLVTASIDYRLLDIVMHPIPVLAPLVLALGDVILVVSWHMSQGPTLPASPTADLFRPDLAPVAVGVVLLTVVYMLDRTWLGRLDLALQRFLLVVVVIMAAGAAYLALHRLAGGALASLSPYLLVGGLAVVYLVDCLTLRFTDTLRNPLYVLMLGVLAIVFVIGQVSGGAQRWLAAGAIQPSELSKIMVIIVLAKFLEDREEGGDRFSTIVTSLGLVGVPMALIYLQPDLGTALTLGAIWLAMIWMAGIRFRYLFLLFGGGLAALPLVWMNLEEYMQKRLLLFISPNSDPDAYFNVHQALVSIGSGGWTGKGLTHGTQSQLHFLRVRHTDFIFAVTAEELGFLGAAAMLGLIFFLLWRMLYIAGRARDTFGRLLAAGVAGLIFFQSAINIGMNLGLMPVTGIPLPFVSYGGSSFLTLMAGVGLVESVAMRHKKLEFD